MFQNILEWIGIGRWDEIFKVRVFDRFVLKFRVIRCCIFGAVTATEISINLQISFTTQRKTIYVVSGGFPIFVFTLIRKKAQFPGRNNFRINSLSISWVLFQFLGQNYFRDRRLRFWKRLIYSKLLSHPGIGPFLYWVQTGDKRLEVSMAILNRVVL